MTTPPNNVPDPSERRSKAVARLQSTGNVDAVARAFNITPSELNAWAADASGGGRISSDDRDRASVNEIKSDRSGSDIRRSEGMTRTRRIVLVVLLVAFTAPFVFSLVHSWSEINPTLPFLERVVIASTLWILKPLVMLAIWFADSH